MTITTIIIFLIILGVIVFVHELGHFTSAKFFGVRVDEFGLGFPPKLFGRKRGETEYSLNWIPLGGFVKIAGEDGENREDPRSFGAKPIWQRAIVLAAGVAMNFLLAIVLFTAVFMSDFPTDVTGISTSDLPADAQVSIQISAVGEGSPAQAAGLLPMDQVLQLDSRNVSEVEEIHDYTAANPGKTISMTIERNGELLTKEVAPRADAQTGEGAIGVSLVKTAIIDYSLLDSIKEATIYTADMTVYIVQYLFTTLRQLVTTGGTTAEVSGPVGMVSMTAQAAEMGIIVLLNFTALISVNLAIVNILPLPALDGGRIMFLLFEGIKGRPVSQELEAKIHSVGFMLLMLLMLIITFQDLARAGLWGKLMSLFG